MCLRSLEFLDPRLPDRFWSKCIPEPNSGCWLWLAAHNADGYGRYHVPGRLALAHRAAFEALIGPVPDGFELDHKQCQTPCCVNPAHVEAVTPLVNWQRGNAPSRAAAERDHCINGHPYEDGDVRVSASGDFVQRVCRQCRRAGLKKHRKAHHAERMAYQRAYRARKKARAT